MLRRATKADIPTLLALQDAPGMADGFNPASAQGYADLIARADREVFVWDNGAVCGLAALAIESKRHFYAEVRKFGTYPAGQGHGSAFAREILHELFNKRGLFRVEVHVYSANRGARAFYERLGFVTEGCLRQAVRRRDGTRSDLIQMACIFSDWNLAETRLAP